MTELDPRRYLLSAEASARIFQDEIVPDELANGARQDHPVVVFVAGQPGAGKTRTTEMIKARLDQRGGAIVVNSDFYKPYHPEYRRLLAEDDRAAAPYTSLDGRRWMAAAEQYLMDNRVDTVVETTMRDPGDFIEPAAAFRAAGYRVETAMMAVPESLSRLGIVHRYHDQVESAGHGRLTQQSNHDASYAGVLDTAAVIDSDRIVDGVSVYRRGNELLYANQLDENGDWATPPAAARAIQAERSRPFTAEESHAFTNVTARLRQQMGPEWQAEFDDIAARAEPLLNRDDGMAQMTLDQVADKVRRANDAIDAVPMARAAPESPREAENVAEWVPDHPVHNAHREVGE